MFFSKFVLVKTNESTQDIARTNTEDISYGFTHNENLFDISNRMKKFKVDLNKVLEEAKTLGYKFNDKENSYMFIIKGKVYNIRLLDMAYSIIANENEIADVFLNTRIKTPPLHIKTSIGEAIIMPIYVDNMEELKRNKKCIKIDV